MSTEIYSVAALEAAEAPASLATIYTAKKENNNSPQNVNALKQQFQTNIERKFAPHQTRNGNSSTAVARSAVIQTRADREVNAFRALTREKSFDEARSAVQSQIEKIFQKAAAAKKAAEDAEKKASLREVEATSATPATSIPNGPRSLSPTRRFTMHGVSHLTPEDEVNVGPTPLPPLHHGVTLQVSDSVSFAFVIWAANQNILGNLHKEKKQRVEETVLGQSCLFACCESSDGFLVFENVP